MKLRFLVILFCFFSVMGPTVFAMTFNCENPFGCCTDCCKDIGKEIVIPGLAKIGTGVMNILEVRNIKHNLLLIQERHTESFYALIKKCLFDGYKLSETATIVLKIYGFLDEDSGLLKKNVKSTIFALVVEDDGSGGKFLVDLIDDDTNEPIVTPSVDRRVSHRPSVSFQGITDLDKSVNSKKFKILHRKEAVRRGSIVDEVTPQEFEMSIRRALSSSRPSSMCSNNSNNGAPAASANTTESTGSFFNSVPPFGRVGTAQQLTNPGLVRPDAAGAQALTQVFAGGSGTREQFLGSRDRLRQGALSPVGPSLPPSADAEPTEPVALPAVGAQAAQSSAQSRDAAMQERIDALTDQLSALVVQLSTQALAQQPAGAQTARGSAQPSGGAAAAQSSANQSVGKQALRGQTKSAWR